MTVLQVQAWREEQQEGGPQAPGGGGEVEKTYVSQLQPSPSQHWVLHGWYRRERLGFIYQKYRN